MNSQKITAAVLCLCAAGSALSLASAAPLDELQKKLDASAQRIGVPAPDVRKELAGNATVEKEDDRAANPLANMPKINRIVAMPANVIRAIEGKDGKIMYMVDNGRFALVGNMVDVWNRKSLHTLDEVEEAISHINLARMGFDLAKTNHITVGTGGEHVTLFVDTRCGWCHKLLQEIQADKELFTRYTFDIVIVTVLGDESRALGERLACAKETDQMKKFNALVQGRSAIANLAQNPGCDKSVMKNTELQQHALDISSVPLVISPDNRFVRGKPENLRAFLDENEARLARERARAAQQAALQKAEKELAAPDDGKKRIPLRPAANAQ